MIKPDKPDNEEERLAALRRYQILDTPKESGFDDLVAIASAICGTPMSSVSLMDADRQWFKAKIGLQDDETPRDNAFCAHAILQPDRMMVVPDALDDARFCGNPFVTGNPHIRFYAGAVLLGAEGLPLGTLCVMDDRPRDLQPYQIDALRALSKQVSRLIELRKISSELNFHLQDRSWYESQLLRYQAALEDRNADLTEQTRTDPLTGLPNRRAFAAALESAISDRRRCSVALLDIDHFKTVNDTHGHAVGDRVLVEIAEQLRATSGGKGVIARYGGEEFVWLLPELPADQAELHCEYLRQAVRASSMALPVSVSIGLAHVAPGETSESALARADAALYTAKRQGRDQLVVADQ